MRRLLRLVVLAALAVWAWRSFFGARRPPERATASYADGSSIVNVVYGTDHANGIGLSPDGKTIYAAETLTGRLWAWDIEEPGKVKPKKRAAAR